LTQAATQGDSTLTDERAAWSAVPVSRRTPMQDWPWTEACFDSLYQNDCPTFVFIGDDHTERHAAAAFAKRGQWAPHLFLVGAEENGEPVDVLYKDEESAYALAERVSRLGAAIRFGHFPAQSLFYKAFTEISRKHGVLLRAPVKGSPYIELDDGWRDPLSQFTSRRRSDLRRMMRKAEKIGAVTFEIVAPTLDNVDQLLDEAIAVEAKSWKSRSQTAIADNENQAAFYRDYARLAACDGIFRISHMKIDGQLVAMQLAVEYEKGFWLFKIGYDETYGACSPGNLLLLETIRRAVENGLSSFEFLGKSADWTKVWTDTERPNVAMRFYPHTVSGYICLIRDAAGIGVRRARSVMKSLICKERTGQ